MIAYVEDCLEGLSLGQELLYLIALSLEPEDEQV